VVIRLAEMLPDLGKPQYVVYTDNFFTNTKLCNALRQRLIATVGTAKCGFEYPKILLELRAAAKKKNHWGQKAATDVDNNTV
jgi:hypothetical protein